MYQGLLHFVDNDGLMLPNCVFQTKRVALTERLDLLGQRYIIRSVELLTTTTTALFVT